MKAVKDAGAIVLGKTNLPRWSGDIQAYNDMFGTTVNPWNSDRVPGGSSGGAAAAVSAGLSSFEIGTDIGGSIRFPAAFCGIYGHKPSFGIVPSMGYIDHEARRDDRGRRQCYRTYGKKRRGFRASVRTHVKKRGPYCGVSC